MTENHGSEDLAKVTTFCKSKIFGKPAVDQHKLSSGSKVRTPAATAQTPPLERRKSRKSCQQSQHTRWPAEACTQKQRTLRQNVKSDHDALKISWLNFCKAAPNPLIPE